MNINTKNFPLYAPVILRIGSSIVYLWFGFQQFLHTSQWIGFIPQFIVDHSPVDAETLVHFNGAIEIVFGIALVIGVFTRISAAILALHMAHITVIVGYDAIGVRDFGIVIATTAVAFFGKDIGSLESYLNFHKPLSEIEEIIPTKVASIPTQFSQATVNMHTNEAMVEYIRQEREKGTPVNIIYNSLGLKGWSIQDIEQGFQTAKENPNS